MKKVLCIAFSLMTFISSVCYGQTQKSVTPEILNNASIIELHSAGLDDDVIISKVEGSQTNFDLSTSKLIQLKKAGVSSNIIKALMKKTNGAANVINKSNTETSTTNVASIDLLNFPYHFDKQQNRYKPIEKAVATMRIKRKAFGMGGTDFLFDIAGVRSNVRIVGDSISFLINTGGNALPELVLYKLKADDEKRSAVGTRLPTGIAGFGKSKGVDNVISYNIILIQNGVYKITIPQRLVSGEYFFSHKLVMSETNTMDVFAFGVD